MFIPMQRYASFIIYAVKVVHKDKFENTKRFVYKIHKHCQNIFVALHIDYRNQHIAQYETDI